MSVNRRATKRGTRWDVRLRRPDGSSYKRTFRTRRGRVRGAGTCRPQSGYVARPAPAAEATFADVAREWLASNPGEAAGHGRTRRRHYSP